MKFFFFFLVCFGLGWPLFAQEQSGDTATIYVTPEDVAAARERTEEDRREADAERYGYAKPRWYWFFVGPTKKNPDDQYALAQRRLERGKTGKAAKALRYLVEYWPEFPQAPQAQRQLAELYQQQGKLKQAFDAYQELITRYAGEFPYDEVVEQQYAIARELEDERVGKFLFLPGMRAPEAAIPFYGQIVTNAPQWVQAPECQHRIGELYQDNGQLDEAILAFDRTVSRYPDTVMAERSAFGKTQCMVELAEDRPNDDNAAESAWAALTLYLEQFRDKDPKHMETAYEQLQDMRARLAESSYQKAKYYDTIARNPRAALIAYQGTLEQYPESVRAPLVRERIEVLTKVVEEQ